METSWAKVDWEAPRPDEQAVRQARARLRYEPVPLPQAGVKPLLTALRGTHVNGGALLARFRAVDDDEVVGWFLSRNRLSEFGLLHHFLDSTAVREALPELKIPEPLDGDLGFAESWSGTLSLDGELAALLVHGGAYEAFPGSPVEAKQLGMAFVDAIVGENHGQCHVYLSYQPWTPWFFDVAWDVTFCVVDRVNREILLLCVTDTD